MAHGRLQIEIAASSLLTVALALMLSSSASLQKEEQTTQPSQVDWRTHSGDAAGMRYSLLTQINRGNVASLQVAWTYDTGEKGILESSPIIVNGVLFGITPTLTIFALNAA